MQCFESVAIGLKLSTELQKVYPELDLDELGLYDLIQDFDVQRFSELNVLINEVQAGMNLTNSKAA